MSLFRLFRVLCCYLLYQGFKRLDRLALRIVLKDALRLGACFGDPNRSWDFRFEHVEVFPVALSYHLKMQETVRVPDMLFYHCHARACRIRYSLNHSLSGC